MTEAKPFTISKRLVWQAWLKVKANKGTAGVDGQSLADFENKLGSNLYKLWNRMSSGSYFPPPVMRVDIKKKDGSTRPLGVPTVADRIAQTVVKMVLEPLVEPAFHEDSYGYRPGRSAHHALAVARKRCWQREWVIDLDIKGFFDNLDHTLMMRAVEHHIEEPWVLLYIKRWLEASVHNREGQEIQRSSGKGTPQGGVISPLLANLFMHYAFDHWLERHIPNIRFERYADDALVHCCSQQEAESVLEAVRGRLLDCGLTLHPIKTKLVYCKAAGRPEAHEHTSFDFLGFTFRARIARTRFGNYFAGFLPAISKASAQHIRDTIKALAIPTKRSLYSLPELAKLINPYVQGWINYFGEFYPSELKNVLYYVEATLVRWSMGKYRKLRGRKVRAARWLGRIAHRVPTLMAHWRMGLLPAVG